MAEIVKLETRRDGQVARPQIRLGALASPAQILLFTGVRYERYGEQDPLKDTGVHPLVLRAE